MSIDVMSYIWKHSPSKGSELLLLLALADCAGLDGTAHPAVKHLAQKCRMTERNVQLLFKSLVTSKQLSIKFGQGPHGCHLFRIHLPKDFMHQPRGEKISGEKISPQLECNNSQENQSVNAYHGEKISGEKISPGVKSSALLQPQISPLPSLDPSEEKPKDLTPPPIVPPPTDAEGRTMTKQGQPRKYVQDALSPDEQQVLDHLNARTGRHYRIPNEISGALNRGCTVAECLLVIDWWADAKRIYDPTQDRYFDNETPFRQKHFDKYRAAAEEWDQLGRPQDMPAPHGARQTGAPLTKNEQRQEKIFSNMESIVERTKAYEAKRSGQVLPGTQESRALLPRYTD
jgi:uncharacterized phage protein (TIGR02220 family)